MQNFFQANIPFGNSNHCMLQYGRSMGDLGTAKRILISMLLQHTHKDLIHDVLVTLMAEICAIVNNRPLIDMSSDPEAPDVLTP